MRKYPITSGTLVGGGSILGFVGVLKSLSKPEQEAVVDAAIAAEEESSGADAYGLSSGSLLGAAVILGMMDEDEDLLDRVTTTPGMDGMQMHDHLYVEPMGSRRLDAVEVGRHRLKAPLPKGMLKRR